MIFQCQTAHDKSCSYNGRRLKPYTIYQTVPFSMITPNLNIKCSPLFAVIRCWISQKQYKIDTQLQQTIQSAM